MRIQSLLIAATTVVLCVSGYSALAEKRELTFVKTSTQTMAKSATALSESPNHEITQEVMHQHIKYSNPDFQVDEEWVYVQADSVDGSGPHKGYFTFVHTGGERTYGSFEGSHKTVVKDDGSWLTTWEGKVRHLGGTGKYKNIKGTGTYKGKVGAKEPFYEEGRDQIEF
ncbi:MAG: hypothetical protein HY067_20590 [Betaproteobacteria bacterium]|nr:hypothetical protein [Betaproteobacteria bacterium]